MQRHDVEIQRRDVTESPKSQRRDVEIQRRDILESVDNLRHDVGANVATLQGGVQNRGSQCRDMPEA